MEVEEPTNVLKWSLALNVKQWRQSYSRMSTRWHFHTLMDCQYYSVKKKQQQLINVLNDNWHQIWQFSSQRIQSTQYNNMGYDWPAAFHTSFHSVIMSMTPETEALDFSTNVLEAIDKACWGSGTEGQRVDAYSTPAHTQTSWRQVFEPHHSAKFTPCLMCVPWVSLWR